MSKNIFEEITVLIVLYRESINLLSKCLESIKNFKIIIIDNAYDKELKREIENKFKIYKYILNKKNIGFSSAANQGIKECDTQYILIHAADCIISNKDIGILLESHQKYKGCFSASPTCYDEDGKLTCAGGGSLKSGKTNEPSFVRHTGEFLSKFFDISVLEFEKITDNNFYNLFSKAIRYKEIST